MHHETKEPGGKMQVHTCRTAATFAQPTGKKWSRGKPQCPRAGVRRLSHPRSNSTTPHCVVVATDYSSAHIGSPPQMRGRHQEEVVTEVICSIGTDPRSALCFEALPVQKKHRPRAIDRFHVPLTWADNSCIWEFPIIAWKRDSAHVRTRTLGPEQERNSPCQ